jgi:hydrogenase nickel incorporation protein HypA/HybF
MHEFSIVQSLITLCEEKAKENEANSISKVVIKIGKLSGVEPELLKTAFETFKKDTMCENAELVLNIVDVKIICNSCSKESVIKNFEYRCGFCDSLDYQIVDGDDMYLMTLEME